MATEGCIYAVLKAVIALIVALDQCEVLSGDWLNLRDDLVALREELEDQIDQEA